MGKAEANSRVRPVSSLDRRGASDLPSPRRSGRAGASVAMIDMNPAVVAEAQRMRRGRPEGIRPGHHRPKGGAGLLREDRRRTRRPSTPS